MYGVSVGCWSIDRPGQARSQDDGCRPPNIDIEITNAYAPSATLPPARLARRQPSCHSRCSDAAGDGPSPPAASFIDTWRPLRPAAAACWIGPLVVRWVDRGVSQSVGRALPTYPHTHMAMGESEQRARAGPRRIQKSTPQPLPCKAPRTAPRTPARRRGRTRPPPPPPSTGSACYLALVLGGTCVRACLLCGLLALVEAGCLAAAGFCFEDGVKETVSPRSAARSPCCNPESACQPIGLWGSVCTAQPLSVRWERKPLGPLDRTATLRQARARLRCLADSSSLFRHGR